MARLWIVHRDPRWRDALLAMAGPGEALVGDPGDAGRFEREPPPRVVLLGVTGDFEAELEFAHRFAPRLGAAVWVLLVRPLDAEEARRLFDAVPASVVTIPGEASQLRSRVRAALARHAAAPLSSRHRRDTIARRFARWLGDLEGAELLAAIDPARAGEALLVRGEPGTGRGLLTRYVHAMTAAETPFAAIACVPGAEPGSLLADIAPETGRLPTAGLLTLCLEDVDELERAPQRVVRGWVEHGPPAGRLQAAGVRWIATAGDPQQGDDRLDPALARALAGLAVRIPPLRERPAAIAAIVRSTGRSFTPEAVAQLQAHPWPGNARELDAVLMRTLAARREDPIGADDLRFDPPILGFPEWEATDAPPPRVDLESSPGGASAPAAATTAGAPSRAEAEPAPGPEATGAAAGADVRRLSAAVAHEVGNPLVGIRTYAAMLPSRIEDPEFRRQFAERVDADTRRIEEVIETLHRLAALEPPLREPVDVSALVARILERERPRIRARRLVVLEELDRREPLVLGDAGQLEFALGLLLARILAWMPPRADLYVATRRHPAAADRGATMALLIRFRAGAAEEGAGFGDNALAVAAVEAVIRAHGGTFEVEAAAAGATTIRLELPAPG